MWSAISSVNIGAFSVIKGVKLWDWVLEWPAYSLEKKQ
jgi:hypothetical protein